VNITATPEGGVSQVLGGSDRRAQTTAGRIIVVADSSAIISTSALPVRRPDHRPHPL